jgi:hypothetical protein
MRDRTTRRPSCTPLPTRSNTDSKRPRGRVLELSRVDFQRLDAPTAGARSTGQPEGRISVGGADFEDFRGPLFARQYVQQRPGIATDAEECWCR